MGDYLLRYWGQAEAVVEAETEDCGHVDSNGTRNFWFDTAAERAAFRQRVLAIADRHRQVLVADCKDGPNVHKLTVASMMLTLPDGRSFRHTTSFGYDYPVDSAHYMFGDGNYGCDCNRSLFINRILLANGLPEIEEFDCGNDIAMSDFKVEQVSVA